MVLGLFVATGLVLAGISLVIKRRTRSKLKAQYIATDSHVQPLSSQDLGNEVKGPLVSFETAERGDICYGPGELCWIAVVCVDEDFAWCLALDKNGIGKPLYRKHALRSLEPIQKGTIIWDKPN